jgi:hypothetical protein
MAESAFRPPYLRVVASATDSGRVNEERAAYLELLECLETVEPKLPDDSLALPLVRRLAALVRSLLH